MTAPIEIAYAHTQAWWDARKTGIGASRAAAVLRIPPTDEQDAQDVSQYGGPLLVYHECRGELTPSPDNEDTLAGRALEAGVATLYEHRIGQSVIHPMPMYRHPEWSYMLATPDVWVSPTRGAELKVSNPQILARIRDQGVAEAVPDYVVQCQQQMAVMGWQVVDLAVLVGKRLHVFELERSDELIEMLAEAEAELWRRIEQGDPPDFDPTEPRSLDLVKRLHPSIRPGIVRFPAHVVELQAEYEELCRQEREIGKRKEQIRAEQLYLIGDHEGGALPDGRYLRRSVQARKAYTVDAKEIVDSRVVKLPPGAKLLDPPEWAQRFDEAEQALREVGFLRHDQSESGSRYWIHSDGLRVRVSHHAPNRATAEWMDRAGCIDLRVDTTEDVRAAVREIAAAELERTEA